MACMDAKRICCVRQELVDLSLEFLGQILKLRTQTSLQPLARPNEPLSQRRASAAQKLAWLPEGSPACRLPAAVQTAATPQPRSVTAP